MGHSEALESRRQTKCLGPMPQSQKVWCWQNAGKQEHMVSVSSSSNELTALTFILIDSKVHMHLRSSSK